MLINYNLMKKKLMKVSFNRTIQKTRTASRLSDNNVESLHLIASKRKYLTFITKNAIACFFDQL